MSTLEEEIRNLFAAYPLASGEPYKKETVIAYARDLRAIPGEVLPEVMREARERSERYLPTIGQIMKIYRSRADYSTHDRPRPAWEFLGMSREAFYARQPAWFRAIVASGDA